MGLCAVSVDLDEIHNYEKIHDLPPAQGIGRDAVYDLALERFHGWASAHQIPLTFFVVGADLSRPENCERLRAMVAAGHELGNHSQDHLYDLVRRPFFEITRQVELANRTIFEATGHRPVGFRAPGYTTSGELYRALEELGAEYSSSVFPCPSYYGLKAASIGAIRLRGRRSKSIVDDPRVLMAPRRPYRVGVPYWKRGRGMLELPIQVTRGLRLPFIGTTLTQAGPRWCRRLTRGVLGEPLVNLELHGIDALDRSDGLEALVPHQFDLRTAVDEKLESLAVAVQELQRAGYSFVTLAEAAQRFATRLDRGR